MRRMKKYQVLSVVYTTSIIISLVTACTFKTDSELSADYRPVESSSAGCPEFSEVYKSENGQYAEKGKNCNQSCKLWNSCWKCDQEKIIERGQEYRGSVYRYDGCNSKRSEKVDDWLQCFCKPEVHADCADLEICCDAKDNSINDDSGGKKCRKLNMSPQEACSRKSSQCIKQKISWPVLCVFGKSCDGTVV